MNLTDRLLELEDLIGRDSLVADRRIRRQICVYSEGEKA